MNIIKIKKITAIVLTVALMLLYTVPPARVFADDSPTPTPTPTAAVDNSAAVTNSSATNSNTGNNSINPTPTPSASPDPSTSPSPTPTASPDLSVLSSPSPTPTPDPSSTVTATNDASVSNNISSGSISGENSITATGSGQIATDSASVNTGSSPQNSTPNASINTGNATSVTTADNSVNSTSVNSKVVNQTINIFVAQNGDINLSDPFSIAASAVQSHPEDPIINVSAVTVNNFAYLANDLVSLANTGNNSVNGAPSSAVINTGNAYSIVSLVNKVNFTIVNSEIHVITINLFGKLNGNIILPDMASTNCAGCGVNLNVNNNASVNNNVSSTAISGQNNITSSASGSASIDTGNAQSAVNNLNIVNTNLVGVDAKVLYITDYGNWNGNFIGWGNIDPKTGGASLVFYSLGPNANYCASCSANTNITNNAEVYNNIFSLANTGGNSINGNGSINTGNAYSAISLVNFINSNFINSIGFFGFLNIFGDWTGDIGGASEFAARDTANTQTASVVNTASVTSQTQEAGGMLSVSQTNNTGSFVKPGDTVTFFVNVKNVGTGTVYGSKLMLYLIRNGVSAGGAAYNLGDIPAGKGVKVTTGLVLAKNTPPGIYTARAFAIGNVGPNNATVTGTADSFFTVLGGTVVNNAVLSANTTNPKEVLGAHYPLAIKDDKSNDYGPLYALVTVIMSYLILRGIREKDKVIVIFGKRVTLEERMRAFKLFLV